jgi:hypothetical protein
MNRAREQAIRAGLEIVEKHRASNSGKLERPTVARQSRRLEFDQARLNISIRSRSSRLPWRGQFAPELIEYLMDAVCGDSNSFFDPFCGSGTVLFESVSRGRPAYGREVNPAAWHLTQLASFAEISAEQKKLFCIV